MLELLRWLVSSDRRKYERFIMPNGIMSKCVYTQSGKRIEFPAAILNISKGGAKFSTGDIKVFPKTMLEISVELPGGHNTILLHGEVIRTYRRQNQGMHFSAVKFKKEDANAAKTIMDFVYA